MEKNAAKQLFQTSDLINSFGRALVQNDVAQFNTDQLRDLEDEILDAWILIRTMRKKTTPIHVKGPNA